MRFFKTKRYLDDEGGAISAFVLVMFLTMIVGGGMGIDFMYHESERAELQDALDRGVLASASFDLSEYEGNTASERNAYLQARVESYLRSNSLIARRNPNIQVVAEVSEFSRRISVTGSYQIDTFFLKLVGTDALTVSGASTAEVARTNLEISMVLDNSSSMSGAKMENLIQAANGFVAQMLTPDAVDFTTISVIPFSATVNAGPILSSYYNLDVWQDYSYCFEFEDADFTRPSMLRGELYEQGQHLYYGNYSGLDIYECAESPIFPFSNNVGQLQTSISNMVAAGNTSTWAGMKWGVALLDPGTGPVVNAMIADGLVDPLFSSRPAAWENEIATKVIILMTDGANTNHYVLEKSTDGYNYEDTDPWNTQENADHWDNNIFYQGTTIDWDLSINGTEGDARLDDICNVAKAVVPGSDPERERIIVYTIGFDVEVNSNPYNRMLDCASSPSKFYHVNDLDLNTAFTQIGASINKLRLVD